MCTILSNDVTLFSFHILCEEKVPQRRRDLFTEVDLVFFDTTSLYFEGRGGESIGKRGHNKDLYQMVVGMAVVFS
jgi:hypothetical protein